MLYSIAETAKINNLKPYEYFKYLLEEIPKHSEFEDDSFICLLHNKNVDSCRTLL